MSLLAGTIIILIAAFTPSALPIGMFWPISLAFLLSLIFSCIFKFNSRQFVLGLLIGSFIYGIYNFIYSTQLAALLLVIQILPIIAATTGLIIGNKIYTHAKHT